MSATAVSGDGSTLLVEDTTGSNPSKVETYVFTISTQKFTSPGYLGSAIQQSYGPALSYDGSVATEYSNLDNNTTRGFLWTAKSGLQNLGTFHSGTYYVEPTCISDDGSVVFGRYTVGNGWVGFRYTTSLNTTPIVAQVVKLSTPYVTTLSVPAPGVIGYAEFTTGASAAIVTRPRNAASFRLKANGAFSYTPNSGFGGKTDSFTYHLIGPNGTSTTGSVQIAVGAAP